MTEVLVSGGHKGTSGRALTHHSITSAATLPLRRGGKYLGIERNWAVTVAAVVAATRTTRDSIQRTVSML